MPGRAELLGRAKDTLGRRKHDYWRRHDDRFAVARHLERRRSAAMILARYKPKTPLAGGVAGVGTFRFASLGEYALMYRQLGIPRPFIPGSVVIADILEAGFLERNVGIGGA